MSYFNLKFRVDFVGHVKNVIINILFFTVYPFHYENRRGRGEGGDGKQTETNTDRDIFAFSLHPLFGIE